MFDQIENVVEENGGVSVQQQSRKPNLSSLQIPVRSLDSSLSNSTQIDQGPCSCKGLPPRPNSAKLKSSVKNLIPQRSLRSKNVVQDGEKSVLIIPDTPQSDCPPDKPSTSRSFSLNKVFFPLSIKAAVSLPATPRAGSGHESVPERTLHTQSDSTVSAFWFSYAFASLLLLILIALLQKLGDRQHITRSFSVPVNIKVRSLGRVESGRGLIRVISATPRPAAVESKSLDDSSAAQVGNCWFFLHTTSCT